MNHTWGTPLTWGTLEFAECTLFRCEAFCLCSAPGWSVWGASSLLFPSPHPGFSRHQLFFSVLCSHPHSHQTCSSPPSSKLFTFPTPPLPPPPSQGPERFFSCVLLYCPLPSPSCFLSGSSGLVLSDSFLSLEAGSAFCLPCLAPTCPTLLCGSLNTRPWISLGEEGGWRPIRIFKVALYSVQHPLHPADWRNTGCD